METDARREEFIDAARELFVSQGIRDTSITQISDRAGVTRSLFYHYFSNKEAIVNAVIDQITTDFMEQVELWHATFNRDDMRASMQALIGLIRSFLRDENNLGSLSLRNENAMLRQQFGVRTAQTLSHRFEQQLDTLGSTAWAESLPHPRETYYVLVIGCMSLMTHSGNVSDDTLIDIIADILHINL